jgi:hypothetical protein
VQNDVKITRDNQTLTLTDFPYVIGVVAFPVAAFMVYHAARAFRDGNPTRDVVGAAFGALFFFAGGAVFTQRNHFHFDLITRQLHWSRRGLFTRAGGALPFDQIRHAVVQSSGAADSDGHTTRAVLVLADGSHLPLTRAYTTGTASQRARTAINEALAVPATTLEDDIRQLALAGQKIDAIRLARTHYGYDLAQARDFIDALTRPNGQPPS